MSKRQDAEHRTQWADGLARLEELTREFQRELGKLQQVAHEGATDDASAAAELAAEPREADSA